MKKVLTLFLAVSLVFGAFAGIAGAADLTTADKYDQLAAAGIFNGVNANGDQALDQPVTRAQLAKVITLTLGLDQNAAAANAYKDIVSYHWGKPYIGAVVEAGIMNGVSATAFQPNANMTIEQLAKVLVLASGLEPKADAMVDGKVSAWAKGYVAAALDAKLIVSASDYTANALRAALVDGAFTIFAPVKDLAIAEVKQIGAKKIQVAFNQAATADQKAGLTYTVKNGPVPYNVTATWADDNKSVVLSNTFAFPAGDYTVAVKGFDTKAIKIDGEIASTLDITAATLMQADKQDLGVKILNQFGEQHSTTVVPDNNISVYAATYQPNGGKITVNGGKVDLSNLKVDDSVVVSAYYTTTGVALTKTKTFKLVNASAVTALQFGPVKYLDGKSRITVMETGLVVPYSLKDQYGNVILLNANTSGAAIATGLKFYSSDNSIVDPANFKVDANGVLTLTAGTKDGTAIITVMNPANGAYTTFNVKVDAAAKVGTFTISNPGVLVAANEPVTVPFVAADNFGVPLDTKSFNSSAYSLQVTFTSSNPSVQFASTPAFDATTGALTVNFSGSGSTTLFAWVNGAPASQINLDVNKTAVSTRIVGVKDIKSLFAVGGTFTFTKDNVSVIDQYGRPVTDATKFEFSVAKKDPAATAVDVNSGVVTGKVAGSEQLVLALVDGNKLPVDNSQYELTATTLDDSKIASFAVGSVGTSVYGYAANNSVTDYAKAINLVGKDSAGNEIAINQTKYIGTVTSSDSSILKVDTTNNKVYGLKAGTAAVAVFSSTGAKLGEQTVTVSEAAPVPATAAFKAQSYAVANGVGVVTKSLTAEIQVTDQYGVAYTTAVGSWFSSDKTIAMVDSNGVVTKVKAGTVTITFVTGNSVTATTTVSFN